MKVNFTLNLTPKPLLRAHHASRGKYSVSYYPKKTQELHEVYENAIIQAYGNLDKELRLYVLDVAKAIKTPAIRLNVVFHMPIPKSVSKKKRAEMIGTPHLKMPDTTNLLKLVEDRAEGIFYSNDKYIYKVCGEKLYADKVGIDIELTYEGL